MINDIVHIGKYTVVKPLGQGGEGCVYLARDSELNRLAAIKRVWDNHKETEERIKREAAFLQTLRHPMLPVVYDLLWDETWYLVMEYIQGTSLHNYINKNGMVQEEQGRIWAGQLLDVLHYFHTRKPPVIYQDLKPENIMVCPEGNLKLVDFGAAYYRHYGIHITEPRAASPGYAAPEQLPGKGRGSGVDERSDIYAFGKVMYYVLTGADPAYPPYTELPLASYAPAIGENWERVIQKCMQDNPAKRYQAAEEIWDDISRDRIGTRRNKSRFIRKIEKRVYITEKKSSGLMAL